MDNRDITGRSAGDYGILSPGGRLEPSGHRLLTVPRYGVMIIMLFVITRSTDRPDHEKDYAKSALALNEASAL